MATKSNNTQGNPYHDESTGQFTSANDSSFKNEVQADGSKHFSIRLKPNIDISAAKNDLKQSSLKNIQPQLQQIGTYKEAKSVQEAIINGRNILPDCLINYSENCNIEKLNELNKALSDIANRFPGFVQNGLLNAYGDGISLKENEIKDVIVKSALNVIQKDKYFSEIYDDFFNQSKQRFDLKDEDKYNEQVFKHFMCLDRQFNSREYVEKKDGKGVLAYYQVSQDNIFNPGQGGKGINGAIKFYNSTLQTPTQEEIDNEAYMVKSGFHFDYGGHSYTYATGVHELGHSIFTIAYKKCTSEERAEINELLRDGTGKDYSQVSDYGHHTLYEQEAESVSDVMCRGENATPHNKKMVAWLDKVHTRLKNAGVI